MSGNGPRWVLLFVLGVFVGCGLLAASVLVRIYCRRATEKLDHIAATRSGAYQFWVGSFNFIILFALAVWCGRPGPPLAFLGLGILFGMAILMIFGFAARARSVGHDMLALGKHVHHSELVRVLAGGAILIVMFFVPVIGQIFWALLLLQCLGTGLLWLFRRDSLPEEPDLTSPIKPPPG